MSVGAFSWCSLWFDLLTLLFFGIGRSFFGLLWGGYLLFSLSSGLLLSLGSTLLLILGLLIGLLSCWLSALDLLGLGIICTGSLRFLAGCRFLFRLFFRWLAALQRLGKLILHEAFKLLLISWLLSNQNVILGYIEVLLNTADKLPATRGVLCLRLFRLGCLFCSKQGRGAFRVLRVHLVVL